MYVFSMTEQNHFLEQNYKEFSFNVLTTLDIVLDSAFRIVLNTQLN